MFAHRGAVLRAFRHLFPFLESTQLDATSCLISDIQMPGLSGTELQVLLLRRGRCFPIIFITAYPNSTEELRALRGGAVCVLHKPLDSQNVITHLKAALNRDVADGSSGCDPKS